jgi:predicted transcriptional regulator
MTRVAVKPELLRWARERAGVMTADDLVQRVPRLAEWEAETAQPTLNRLLKKDFEPAHWRKPFRFRPETAR